MTKESGQTSWKRSYWDWRRTLQRYARLLRPDNRPFASVVIRDFGRYLKNPKPLDGASRERAKAAADWLMNAQRATPDGGVPVGYFPCNHDVTRGWMPSYPETTGYIMQSLIAFGDTHGDPECLDRAREMGQWEADVQMPSGAVQGGPVCEPARQHAAVFNTGMVLQGWTALLAVENDERILNAARRAADFLVEDQGTDGHFRTHGPFVTNAEIKTYNCLCGWALYRFADITGDKRYADAAVKAAEAAIGEQRANGWFANNCLTRPLTPLTHTIGYTLQGLLEISELAEREDIVLAARTGADAVLAKIEPNGYLAGRFDADWQPAGGSSCLTGNAQIAIVAYRLFEITGDTHYREKADCLVNFCKAMQDVTSTDKGINGALAGSFPITGDYMTWGYPNWATKYFLDSLMLQQRCASTA